MVRPNKPKSNNTRRLSIVFDVHDIEFLEDYANKNEMTLSAVIRKAVKDYRLQNEKELFVIHTD